MKRLVMRLSSLGDVILSTTVLRSDLAKSGVLDWVVFEEFSLVLCGHPGIRQVLPFSRKVGLIGWVKFCKRLWEERYDEIIDLHLSLRTRIARVLFFYWSVINIFVGKGWRSLPRWKVVKKERWKSLSYCLFKGFWAKKYRPRPWVERFFEAFESPFDSANVLGYRRPSLDHLLSLEGSPSLAPEIQGKNMNGKIPRKYYCVMPSSRWPGKEWPAKKYITLIEKIWESHNLLPVVLGANGDSKSHELVELLRSSGLWYYCGVGVWNLKEVARVISQSVFYLGCDTGLFHLAQGLGVPSMSILGPTVSDMGFGALSAPNEVAELSLWCRPCGKDGRICVRWDSPYKCLNELSPQTVYNKTLRLLSNIPRSPSDTPTVGVHS